MYKKRKLCLRKVRDRERERDALDNKMEQWPVGRVTTAPTNWGRSTNGWLVNSSIYCFQKQFTKSNNTHEKMAKRTQNTQTIYMRWILLWYWFDVTTISGSWGFSLPTPNPQTHADLKWGSLFKQLKWLWDYFLCVCGHPFNAHIKRTISYFVIITSCFRLFTWNRHTSCLCMHMP